MGYGRIIALWGMLILRMFYYCSCREGKTSRKHNGRICLALQIHGEIPLFKGYISPLTRFTAWAASLP